ncbi:hypothetical protein [Streptomyces avicenniae]|uniref:hypothetical protein n=1 Tax=Streptomyces avicenniae TaxID=500153 RepID=UPI00069C7384|nr:hypothetical protein [Streptomyces avicenniae]
MPIRRNATATTALSAALLAAAFLGAAPATAAPAGAIHPGADDSSCLWWSDEGQLDVRLVNIPDPVVAGQWATFSYRVTNTYDEPVDGLVTMADISAYDTTDGADVPLTAQWRVNGKWKPLEARGWFDWFGTTDPLEPGQSATARVRVKVAADAPDWALGSAAIAAANVNGGMCERTLTDLEFDIAAATP